MCRNVDTCRSKYTASHSIYMAVLCYICWLNVGEWYRLTTLCRRYKFSSIPEWHSSAHTLILFRRLLVIQNQLTQQQFVYHFPFPVWSKSRSRWPRGLRCRSTAARLLKLWVRMPPGAWKSVCCECCMMSGRGLCIELITRPEESYRLWCVVLCDLETSRMRRPWPALGRSAKKRNIW